MAEETSNSMNLDLNLGPSPEPGLIPPVPSEAVNLDELIEGPIRRIRDAARHRARQRWRWRQVLPLAQQNMSMELNELMVNSSNGTALLAGEGSAAAEERTNDATKTCENNTCFLEEDVEGDKKDDTEKGVGSEGSFFDCNICLDLAREPVVTCCGHLFCWPCLYQWIHVHADAKECPVCKGEVTIKNVTPIYGRGNSARIPEEDPSVEIPVRPHARRVESLRQTIQRSAFNMPMEEMIRRLGSRFDLTGDVLPQPDAADPGREAAGRTTSSLLDRFLLSRAMRTTREQNPVVPPDGLTQNGTTSSSEGESRRLHSYLLRRSSHSHRHSALSSAVTAERLVEAYFRNHTLGRRSQEPPPVDDRDSFSSIAAVINSESQVDTAMEIDSLVSLSTSTSTSRRRNDPSRVSDLDSGDSRAPRRRRLN